MLSDEDFQKCLVIERQLQELLYNAEKSAEFGDVDTSYELLVKTEELRKEQEAIASFKDEKKTMVCEVSGNLMSSKDNDERIRAHYEGKQVNR